MAIKYDKILGEIREDDSGTVLYITNGSNGIQSMRWESSPGAVLYDMTIDDNGHVVTTAVGSFALLLETGDTLLLETGDSLLLE